MLRPGISIRTPTIYEGLELPDNTMTVLEDLPSAIDLSSWLRSYGTSTPKSQLQSLGRTIGAWLRRFHDWAMSDAPSAKDLRLRVAENTAMKDLKWTINMGRYHPAPDEFPKLEWEPKAVYEDIERDLRRRVFEEGQMVIHGDFWPGKSAAAFSLWFITLTDSYVASSSRTSPSLILLQMRRQTSSSWTLSSAISGLARRTWVSALRSCTCPAKVTGMPPP